MSLGQPETTMRLDNVHRFLAGIYLGCGIIALWAAITIRQQGTLIYLIALGVCLGAIGRLISMAKVGVPDPPALWFGYAAFRADPAADHRGGALFHAAPRVGISCFSALFNSICHHTRADGSTALADHETLLLLNGDRHDQVHFAS